MPPTPPSRAGRRLALAVAALALVAVAAPLGGAVHFYRGAGGGCTPADGALTDDAGASGPVAATVILLHNSFHDEGTLLPVTTIAAGEAVTWSWSSAHCHSVQGGAFYSGFHYPSAEPDSPSLVPGLFDYPVPEEDGTLSFTHTFAEPGVYTYACEHHAAIGMVGVVLVT